MRPTKPANTSMALSVDEEREAERGELGIFIFSFNFSFSFDDFDWAVRSIEEKDTRGAPEIKVEVVLSIFSTVTIHERAGGREEKEREEYRGGKKGRGMKYEDYNVKLKDNRGREKNSWDIE